jgi:hypothetical protein
MQQRDAARHSQGGPSVPEPAILERLRETHADLYTDAKRVGDAAAGLLSRIVEVFPHYTSHDVSHCMKVAEICQWVAGKDTLATLNAQELFVLFCAICLHDIGMVVAPDERDSILASVDFQCFAESCPLSETEALAEWVRRSHHQRSADFIRRLHNAAGGLCIPDPALANAVALICESHGERNLDDCARYDPFHAYGTDRTTLCLPLLGVLLRLSDVLHVTADRAPLAVVPFIRLESAKPKLEWQKHLATFGVAPMPGGAARVTCVCSDPDVHREILRLCDYINDEFRYCATVLGLVRQKGHPAPELSVGSVDPQVQADGYKPWLNLSFQLDREGMLDLITGSRLYESRGAVLRELLMNAVDAVWQRARLVDIP